MRSYCWPIFNTATSRFSCFPFRPHTKEGDRNISPHPRFSFPKGNSVNFGIPKEYCSVTYESYNYCVSLSVGPGCFIAKADLESAFRIIPVHPEDYHLLGFTFADQYYYDKCLPMGCSISCKVFEQFSCALQWILQHIYNVTSMSHIFGRFPFPFYIGVTLPIISALFLSVAELLALPIKHSKTVVPSKCAIVHGIEIDTVVMQARLPQDKLDSASALVKTFSRRKKVTLRELQSLIGTLSFASKVVVGGRPFLRRFIDLTIGIVKPHFHIRLSMEARLDLAAWSLFLESYNGTSLLWESSDKLELFTDVSRLGFAGILAGQWFQGY